MFKYHRQLMLFFVLLAFAFHGSAKQYESSIYMSPKIIGGLDVSVHDTTEFIGWDTHEIYDRRIPAYEDRKLAIYKISWKDGSAMEIQVLEEVFNDRTKDEVLNELVIPFAYRTGQLPFFLLNGIKRLVLLEGDNRWSASLGSIYIHLDHTRINSGFVEEILLHEGGHASIDELYAESSEWKAAQQKDSLSLSKYGSDNIDTEDLTESIIFWLAVRYRHKRISVKDSIKIVESMPARLAFLDRQNFDAYPFDQPNEFDYMYEVSRHPEADDVLKNTMTFGAFISKAFLVLVVVMAFFLIRFVIRNADYFRKL